MNNQQDIFVLIFVRIKCNKDLTKHSHYVPKKNKRFVEKRSIYKLVQTRPSLTLRDTFDDTVEKTKQKVKKSI